jgi:hypothetical protein
MVRKIHPCDPNSEHPQNNVVTMGIWERFGYKSENPLKAKNNRHNIQGKTVLAGFPHIFSLTCRHNVPPFSPQEFCRKISSAFNYCIAGCKAFLQNTIPVSLCTFYIQRGLLTRNRIANASARNGAVQKPHLLVTTCTTNQQPQTQPKPKTKPTTQPPRRSSVQGTFHYY